MSNPLEFLIPQKEEHTEVDFLWATVTAISPALLIRFDGDDAPLLGSPIPMMDERTITVGMRVLALIKDRRVYIIGPDNPSVYTELVSLRSLGTSHTGTLASHGTRLNAAELLTRHLSENTSNGRVYFGGVGGEAGATNGVYLALDAAATGRGSAMWLRLASESGNSMSITADGGLNMPRMPYAMAAGEATLTTSGSGQTITFPSGRFNVVPRIYIKVTSTTGNSVAVPWFGTKSTSGISLATIFTLGGARIAGTVEWLAVQMTTTAASG